MTWLAMNPLAANTVLGIGVVLFCVVILAVFFAASHWVDGRGFMESLEKDIVFALCVVAALIAIGWALDLIAGLLK